MAEKEPKMAGTYIIASDLGSQSVKTSVYDTEGRKLGSCNQDTRIHTLGPGALVYDGEEFYRLTVENIRSLVHQIGIDSKDVAVISFSGMGGGVLGVDENWRPTSEYTNPIDSRDQPCFSPLMQRYGDLIRSKSGTGSPMAANKMVWFKRNHPEVYRKSKKFMIVTQYVQGKLAGTRIDDAFWENTSCGFTGLADLERIEWSDEILRSLELDETKLPRLVKPTEIIGRLTREAAADCGLAPGIPIAAGAFDKPCDTLGSGSNEPGNVVDNAATYPAITACVDRFTPDMKHRTLECHPSAIAGIWMLDSYITGGGLTHKWFVDTFCAEQKARAEREKTSVYHLLDEEAAGIPPGAEGLLFVPHLNGRATPCDPEVRGLWIGFTWSHRRPHFYRALLESVAYEHAAAMRAAKDHHPNIEFNRATVLGGGAESRLWNRIKSDVLGVPYARLDREDLATLGAAIIGGKAVGLFSDMQATARGFSRVREKYEPNAASHERYERCLDAYMGLFQDLKPTFGRLYRMAGSSR